VSYGILPADEAARLHDIVAERKRSGRVSGAMSSPVKSSSKSNQTKKVKKAKIYDDDGFDPDMQISSGDGIGRTSL
jgi:hypothetical protein